VAEIIHEFTKNYSENQPNQESGLSFVKLLPHNQNDGRKKTN